MTDQKTLSKGSWLDLILLSLIWGGSFLAFRVALDEIGVFTTVAHRVFWAALILWAFVLLRGYSVTRGPGIWMAALVMGALNNAVPFSLIAWGQLHVESGLAAIFNSTTAFFGVLVAAAVFADERLTMAKIIGVVLGTAGAVVAIGTENLKSFDLRTLGQIAILGASFSYAIAAVWARAHLSNLKPPVAAAMMLTGSSLIMVPLAYLIDGRISFDLELSTWGAIVFVSVLATAIAYLLYYRILDSAGASNLLLCTLLIVPVAIVLGAWVRDESLPPSAFLGFGILAAGLLVIDGRLFRRR